MIRVLIVDDHPLVQRALAEVIDLEEDINVVAVAGTLGRARELLSAGDCCDVAVVDLGLPDGNGLELVAELRESGEGPRILVLTGNEDQAILPRILAAGCAGILVKRAQPAEVITAIRTVAEGRSFIGVGLDPVQLGQALSGGPASRADAPRDVLSPREKEVLVAVARGHTNQEIGTQLGISPKTVATYRSRLSDKLDFSSRAEIVQYALDAGLLDSEE